MCLDFGKGTSLLVGSVYNEFFFSHAISRKIVRHLFMIYSVEMECMYSLKVPIWCISVTIHDDTPEILNKSSESAPVNDFHNETTPFLAPIFGCQRVTSEDHFQDTRLVEFDISGSKITGKPLYRMLTKQHPI